METSLKTGFAQIFSCCPKNLSCPKFGGAAAPLAPPVHTPMNNSQHCWLCTLLYGHLLNPETINADSGLTLVSCLAQSTDHVKLT